MTDNERYLRMKRQKEIERKWREQQQQEECDCESDNCEAENYGEISSGRRNNRTNYEPIRGGGFDVKLDVGNKQSKGCKPANLNVKVSSKLVSHEFLPFSTNGKCLDCGDGTITGATTSNGI
jgi:hypothetical protein